VWDDAAMVQTLHQILPNGGVRKCGLLFLDAVFHN
jgi:hypothetical protein